MDPASPAPPEVAEAVADSATLETNSGELNLCPNGSCSYVADASAGNAESAERRRRGESGWEPWWRLPDRKDRR